MSDFSRAEVRVEYGSDSALVDPEVDRTFVSTPASPDHQLHQRITVGTTEETIDLSAFTTIQELFVKNHDATNYVLVKGQVKAVSKTFVTNKLGFVDGGAGADTITDADSAFLTGQYIKAGDYLVVTGCSDTTANNKTFGPVTAVVAGTVTVPTAQTTTEAAEAGLVTMVTMAPFTAKITGANAGWVKIDNINPDADLIFIANTAACKIEYIIIGT